MLREVFHFFLGVAFSRAFYFPGVRRCYCRPDRRRNVYHMVAS